jgi:glycosyltransferase involved in cell wall biosynthesis
MKFVDLLLYSEEGITDFETLYKKHRANLGYLKHLPADFEVTVVQHANFAKTIQHEGARYSILKGRNSKWEIPWRLFIKLRRKQPYVLLVHSMVFSWQIIFLGLIKHRKSRIIVQHHAEHPGKGFRRIIEKMAAAYIDGFLFVSKVQAQPWREAGIISRKKPVFEVMEGSTYFSVGTEISRSQKEEFLWVGRLDRNKDPLTILSAFCEFMKDNKRARLKMIYNAGDLKKEVEEFIGKNGIGERVSLLSNVAHEQMQSEYLQADYFILGSYYESGGYALCEAMACGCVPIVTNIPSFSNMVKNGEEGFLFSPGNHQELLSILRRLDKQSYLQLRKNVLEKFESELSFKAIAGKLSEISRVVTSQKER